MRTISKEELERILENHKHYPEEDVYEWITMKANLSEADLVGAELRGVDLKYANLRGASLNLADLSEANLTGADLQGADLSQSDLAQANLRGANLRRANLIDADLSGAILMGADINMAKLPDPEAMNSICPLVCPEEGAFIGWKKADVMMSDEAGFPRIISVIVKLQILAHAKRSSATSRKCRCNEAKVLDIQSLDGKSLPKGIIANSRHDPTFTYTVGQKIWVEDFDNNRWNECSTGIHFFITRQEAVDY